MNKPISFLQSDSKWANIPYCVEGKEKSTIKSAGCGPTCAAMVISSLTEYYVTPSTTCEWSMKNGFKAFNQGTYYTYFTPQLAEYGIKCIRLNTTNVYHNPNNSVHNTALELLKNGNWLICCMGPGIWTKGGHFILVYKYTDGTIYVNDPASASSSRTKNTWDNLKNEVKYYFAITVTGNNGNVDKDEIKEPEDLYWGICTGDNVRIRRGKSVSTSIVGKANKGDGLTCSPSESDGVWIKVYHAGLNVSGYMHSKYIQKETNTEVTKVVNNKVDKKDALYWGVCTGNNVRLREKGSILGSVLGKVNKGEGMTCNPKESNNSWIKVYHAGLDVEGYISAKYIKRS